ncbi:MAG: hypothetical protein DRJ42_25505 [Deltaproteobacteria bacterium]|nr:MAG: hypothetical protein DRJ42_25505 [Deltaproteobacteria bacterium]
MWIALLIALAVATGCDGGEASSAAESRQAGKPLAQEVRQAEAEQEWFAAARAEVAGGRTQYDVPPQWDSVMDGPREQVPEAVVGRWTGDTHCLVVLANGDVELIVRDSPKLSILGVGSFSRDEAQTIMLRLTVAGVWAGRWISHCREHHETGRWKDETSALRAQFRPGEATTLSLRLVGTDDLEVCGDRDGAGGCVSLQRHAPHLPASWSRRWQRRDLGLGDVAFLQLGPQGTLRYVDEPEELQSAYGEIVAEPEGGDGERWRMRWTATRLDSGAPAPPFEVLSAPVVLDQARELVGRRLPGQLLELCPASGCTGHACCVVLPRQFDGYSYGVE